MASTEAHLFDEAFAKEIIEIGVDQIYVSLDGVTKETYEKIRVGSNFETVVNNIRNFVRLKKEMRSIIPQLRFRFSVMKPNTKEIPQFIDLVHSFGEKDVKIVFHELQAIKHVEEVYAKIPEEIKMETEKKAKRLGIKVEWAHSGDKQISECTAWAEPFIMVDGTVQPCCPVNEEGYRHFLRKCGFGNVFQKNLNEIWNSERYTNFRRMMLRGEVPVLCEKFCREYTVNTKRS